jgi:beta-glucosidase
MDLKALLQSLTVEEKAGQLAQLPPFFFDPKALQEVAGPVQRLKLSETDIFLAGSVLGAAGPEEMLTIQQQYLDKSRHKIPLIFMADIIHGYKTIFPIPLALSGSFTPDNAFTMARASAKEATLSGLHVTFSPMADLVKDPRWGRVMESFGEDPYLAYHGAYAMTKGYQGTSLRKKDSLAACVKHFAAYGTAMAGRDYAQAHVSLHDFYTQFDAGYRGAIDAGAAMVMTAFNVFEGIPSTIHQHLLKKVLRKRYGFKGVTISDYDSIIETVVHRVSQDDQDAVRQALLATVDVEMASGAYIKHIPVLVKHGLIPETLLDQAVLRILKLKAKLGLFKDPFKGANSNQEKQFSLSQPQREVAKKLANESIVLLKNTNQILPLTHQKVALLGKLSQTGNILGPWSWHGDRHQTQTILQAFPKNLLTVAESQEEISKWDEVTLTQVQASDVLVVVTGEEERESGEARSKVSPMLSEATTTFLHELKRFQKPIIVVIMAGRPLVLTPIIDHVDGLLYVYFLGTEAATSLVETLYGHNNPSAKLTMSFPRHLGQIPLSYNHYNTGRPFLGQSFTYTSHYIDESNEPLFPFGYGLSYAAFKLANFHLDPLKPFTVNVTIHNVSDVDGTVIIPVYMRIKVAPVATANRQLVGSKRIFIKAQEQTTISISLDQQWFRYIDPNYTWQHVTSDVLLMVEHLDQTLTMTVPMTALHHAG